MATAPPKLFTAAKQASTPPQAITHAALYLPMGSLCSSLLVGYSQAVYVRAYSISTKPFQLNINFRSLPM
jgi:hypothetical protein